MHFVERPPSTTWEPIPLASDPQCFVWAWFKPAAAPQGMFVQIPAEAFQNPLRRQSLTIRTILSALEVDPRQVAVWSLYGVSYDGQQLANSTWDYPIPDPGTAADPSIGIYLHPTAMAAPALAASPVSASPGACGGVASATGDDACRRKNSFAEDKEIEVRPSGQLRWLTKRTTRREPRNRQRGLRPQPRKLNRS